MDKSRVSCNSEDNSEKLDIACCGLISKRPIDYFLQVTAIFIVIIACVINLSTGTGIAELWASLLGAAFGYLLPNPKIRKLKRKNQIIEEAAEALHDVATFLPELAVQ